jgi:bacteriorhodopsin
MRKTLDALLDILILAVLVFTVIATLDDVFMKYLLTIVGCGAMFNNFKYLYQIKKKQLKDPNEPKK